VIVNLKDDPETALRGVLWQARGSWFVLRHPVALNPHAREVEAREIPFDVRELVIPRENVAFFQVVA
jgi:hypothetical protein